MTAPVLDLVTVGRVSVDLYPREAGHGFDAPQTFVKSIGGSPTNVAVGAARLGLRSAAATGVGSDGFGEFVRARLAHHGVDTRFVQTVPGAQTPLAVVALAPPETPQVAFYRPEPAPDTRLAPGLLDGPTLRSARALWFSHAALAGGTTAESLRGWLAQRDGAGLTVLDLDYRPALWPDAGGARSCAQESLSAADVVVGNREECQMALGTSDPHRAADALLAAGVSLAVVKLGGDGVLVATSAARETLPTQRVDVVCGLGAGDAFGAALVHGLLAGHDPVRAVRTASDAGAFVASRLTCSDDMPTPADLAEMEVRR